MAVFNTYHRSPSVRAYAAAILLHVLLFTYWTTLQDAARLTSPIQAPRSAEPVQFEFVDVADVASPAPQETPLASHQNQEARDLQDHRLPDSALPYSDGIGSSKESFFLSQGQSQVADTGQKQENEAREKEERVSRDLADQGFDFSEVLRQDPQKEQKAQERAVFGPSGAPKEALSLKNLTSGALARGGFQLSTYAWNFAPYMAYLKDQINRHIFPPRAFDLGLIEGKTQVRFRIYRDGRLEGPQLLGFEGSEMLKNTSVKSVELSAPFRALPGDFPDDYLEVTGYFAFLIMRGPQP